MMLKFTVIIAVLCGAATAVEGEDGGDWSFRCRAFITVASADNPGGGRSEFMEGAPILFHVVFGLPVIPDDSPRGPSDIYYFGAGCPFIVAVGAAPEEGPEALEPELALLTPFTTVHAPSSEARVWFSATWGFLDERLGSGSYVLRFRPTARLMMIDGFEPAEASIHVRKPKSTADRYALARQKARFHMCTGRLHWSESILLGMDKAYPGYVEPAGYLASCYDAFGNSERSFAYHKEYVRRLAAGRPRNPKHAELLGGKNPWGMGSHDRPEMSDDDKCQFSRAAVKAGAATQAEGRALLEELFSNAKAGKDTGELPKEYLEPLLRGPGPRAAGSGALLAAGVMTAALLALGACVFLIATSRWRRARPDGSTS